MRKHVHFSLGLSGFLLLFTLNGFAQPKINYLNAYSGLAGSSIMINGSDFNAVAAANIVYFGPVKATVTAASAGSLTVTVPPGAGYNTVSVLNTATGLTGYLSRPFITLFTTTFGTDILDGFYLPRVDFMTGAVPYSVAVADVDGDGKADMIAVNYNSNTVSVYRNTSVSGTISASSFAPKVDFATGAGPYALAVGDVDGDGKPDLVIANNSASTVSVLRNTAVAGIVNASSFAAGTEFSTGTYTYPLSVTIGDIDGDGKPDIVAASPVSNTVSVLQNIAVRGTITASSFAEKVSFSTGSNPRFAAIADLDGDGKRDIVVTNQDAATVSVLHNISVSGSITAASFEPKIDFATGAEPYAIATGDIDGDGKPELVVANHGSATVSVLRNTAFSGTITAGSFSTKTDYAVGTQPFAVTISDLNGDGKPDVATANAVSGTASVLRNTATFGSISASSFAAKTDFATAGYPLNISVQDFDNDGSPEVAVTTGSGNISVLKIGTVASPVVRSLNPATGPLGSTVTIWGTNYNATPGNNIVYFGGVKATVTGGTDTSLNVTVPGGNNYKPVSVLNTATGRTGTSTNPFVTSFPNPLGTTGIPANYFQPAVGYPAGGGSYTLSAVGDIDGDNKPDLVAAGSSGVAVFRNTAATGIINAASFAAPVSLYSTGQSIDVALSDLDGDGKLDIVVISGQYSFSVLRNNSTPGTISAANFTKTDITVGAMLTNIGAGDLDGDGKPEIVATSLVNSSLFIYRNISTRGSIDSTSFAAGFSLRVGGNSIAINDLDGDGKPELITIGSSRTVVVVRNISTPGSLTASSFALGVGFATGNTFSSSAYSLVVGDLDGDGKPEIANANYSYNSVSVLRNTTTTGPINSTSFATNVDFPLTSIGGNPSFIFYSTKLTIGDLDGDGKPDLIANNAGTGGMSILRNTAVAGGLTASSFAPAVLIPDYANALTTGDLDGDGIPEIINGSSAVYHVNNLKTIPVITSFTPGSGQAGTTVTVNGAGFSANTANNLVYFGAVKAVVTAASSATLTVTAPTGTTYQPLSVLNTENGLTGIASKPFINTFTNPFSTGIPGNFYQSPVSFSTGSLPFGAGVADLDGDGKADLVVANYNDNTVSVLRNISSTGSMNASSFAAKVDFATGTNPIAVITGDVDGDGKTDIIVTNHSSGTVSVLRNKAVAGSITAASFAAKTDFLNGNFTYPYSTAAGDLDGDGKIDLAVANTMSDRVALLRNTSTSGVISFADKVEDTTGSQPRFVLIRDINGDRKADIITANMKGNSISVLRNMASPGSLSVASFAARTEFATGTEPDGIAVGDLDNDGRPDIVAANFSSGTLSVLRNTSTTDAINSSSFDTKRDYISGNEPFFVTIADADGDGKPDLLSVNASSNTLSVLRNNTATGSFTAASFADKTDFTAAGYPLCVTAGDLDNDGLTEVVTANGSNTLSVFKISSPTMAAASANGKGITTELNKTIGKLQVYPNPSTGEFTLQLLKLKSPVVTIEILNEDGSVVQRRLVNHTDNKTAVSVKLSLAGRPAGVYYVKVTSVDGVQIGKIVLQQ